MDQNLYRRRILINRIGISLSMLAMALGLIVLLYLGVLFVFAYWLKREYWKEVH